MNLDKIRKNYLLHELDENQTGDDPITFFLGWLTQAIEINALEPTAMVLATVGDDLKPSSRVVLLKGCEDGEFRFFTNYNSRKGQELNKNPHAALLFFWKELERQVRIEGVVRKLSDKESDEYFNSRPLESKIGALISPQSNVIENREYLEHLFVAKSKDHTDTNGIQRPIHWGGYTLVPEVIEFWQGRPSRLHDRIRFRIDNKKWIRERLAP